MKEVHNKMLYKKYFDRYSRIFIENFCAAQKIESSRKHAFAIARIKLQDMIITEMATSRTKALVIATAYRNTVKDQQLYEKALTCFQKYKETNLGK